MISVIVLAASALFAIGAALMIRAEILSAESRGYKQGYREGQQKSAFDMALLQTEIDGKRNLPPTQR